MSRRQICIRNMRTQLAIATFAISLFWLAGDTQAQRINFNSNAPTVKILPFAEFDGNQSQLLFTRDPNRGLTTANTPLGPSDFVQLPDGRYLANTLGGTVKLYSRFGNFIDDVLTPNESQSTFADPVRYGSSALKLHPNFNTPGTFGYRKAYHLVVQPPVAESATRPNNNVETGVRADFTIPETVIGTGAPIPNNGIDDRLDEFGTPFAYKNVIREYDLSALADNSTTSYVGNAPPSRDIFSYDQVGASHGVFDLDFNQAGDLFITIGDGGFTDDNPLFLGRNPRQSSQNLNEVAGKILRINPNVNAYSETNGTGRLGENQQYSIPASNPYYDTTQDPTYDFSSGTFNNNDGDLDEIYANGVRSPYRLSLDPSDTSGNTLILGDVGGGSREEITRFGLGNNLGWGRFEGNVNGPSSITLEGNTTVTRPSLVYAHSPQSFNSSNGEITAVNASAGGVAVAGGEVYTGDLLGPDFDGQFIGAEFGFHNFGIRSLSRLFIGDLDDTEAGPTLLNIDPSGQQFPALTLTEDSFSDGFDFDADGVDFEIDPDTGEVLRLLPEVIYGIVANSEGELFLLGGDAVGRNGRTPADARSYISRIVPADFDPGIAGDFDGEGNIDGNDFLEWQRQDGTNAGLADWLNNYSASSASNLTASVPEPGTASLLSFVAAFLLKRKRR